MTMKEKLTALINSIHSNDKIQTLSEADIRTQVINPFLERLGWETVDKSEVAKEFVIPNGKVDYALLVDNSPMVFIEAKRPSEDLISHRGQLVAYCANRRVPLAVLTNGLKWLFYLRPQDGNAEDQQFCELSIRKSMSKHAVSYISDHLIEFLSRERVCSGEAVSNAEDRLVQFHNDKKVKEALPRAWNELMNGLDPQLVKLLDDKVEDLCGLRAGTDQAKEYIARRRKGGAARKPDDPSYPRRAASEEAVKAEWMASFKSIVWMMSPNLRCPDCDDVIERSENDSTSTCKSCGEYLGVAASAGRLSGRGPAHSRSAPSSPLPLVQGTHGSRGVATETKFDIKRQRVVILGSPGSGKTVMARHFAGLFDPIRLAVWDPMNEYMGGPGVHVPPDAQDKTEFNRWLASTLPSGGMRSSRFDGVIIDEANLCFPQSKTEMRRYPEIEKFINLNRQFGVTFIAISKRPAWLSTDVLEMASAIIVFKLTGANDVRKLNDINNGMGRDAAALPPFHFLICRDGYYKHYSPIKMSEVKG